ncbi:MAG: prepilin peptidase [Phycisphaerales bacterium]
MNYSDFNLAFAVWAPVLMGTLFVFLFGACVGSFLNVLAWRLPTGQSVVTPPSRCPLCGHRLSWRENLPIIGWLILRGRCKGCRAKISIQYPLIELLVACIFAAAYLAFYGAFDRVPGTILGDAASPWWHLQGFSRSWPALFLILLGIGGLVGMSIIDAKWSIIPPEIPTVVTVIAFAGWLGQGFMPESRQLRDFVPMPVASWTVTFAAIGMLLGLGVSRWLVATGRLRMSFADWQDYVKEGDDGGAYPHARREMLAEVYFLLPGIAGAGVACVVAAAFGFTSSEPVCQPMTLLGGSMLGWIVGGGLIWAIRIIGTLAFGREAMGLGDVHLQAAVGAMLGWKVALFAFFVAVFLALVWALASRLLGRFVKLIGKEMPLGPHLAAAAILFVVARGVVVAGVDAFSLGIAHAGAAAGGPPVPDRSELSNPLRADQPGTRARRLEREPRFPLAELAQPSDRR